MALTTARERYFLFNGLVCLAQGLQGHYTTVDLRNETSVSGKIEQVDGFMNVSMSDVIFIDTRGTEYAYDSFFIHARKIRYIHIPDKMPIIPTIKSQLGKVGRRHAQPQLPAQSWKGKRLAQRQQETLRLVQEIKDTKSASTSTSSS